ncbi:helix-turn-helix domain-containing protein [Serratia grimesii]|uniref:helix-turn-helix domain-containing protein n=1 Tax=Serratia grimesii TaxID=82995 RepID=UPI0039B125D0
MKNESLYFSIDEMNSEGFDGVSASEELTFDVTEDILILMEDKEISKTDLAKKLGKTKAYISQLLSGSKNMTLKTLSDVCHAIGVKPTVEFIDIERIIISDSTSPSFTRAGWQEYVIEDDRTNPCNMGVEIVKKSNIIYRTERDHWQKVAA